MKYYRDSIVVMLRSLIVGVFLGSIILLGCQSSQRNPRTHILKLKTVIPPRVALAPGDVLDVKFFHTPELNESQTIRPDGKIALQLVGEINAEGKTPGELRDTLLELYLPHLKSPEINVVVRSFYNRRVFVGGEVVNPGIVEMPGKMTALEAIVQAGGFDIREAELKNVVVIRHKGGKRYGHALNLESAVNGDETRPFFLESQDIVYVPQTEIAKLGQWIDQHINKIIPDTGMFYRWTSGDTTIGVGSYR